MSFAKIVQDGDSCGEHSRRDECVDPTVCLGSRHADIAPRREKGKNPKDKVDAANDELSHGTTDASDGEVELTIFPAIESGSVVAFDFPSELIDDVL